MDERHGHDEDRESTLITSAAPDRDAVFAARKRRYYIMMAIRVPALIIASIVYGLTQNGWLAVAIIVVSIPLPWIAVLQANDTAPRKHGEVPVYHYGSAHHAVQPALPPEPQTTLRSGWDDDAEHPVIDAEPGDQPGDEPGDPRVS